MKIVGGSFLGMDGQLDPNERRERPNEKWDPDKPMTKAKRKRPTPYNRYLQAVINKDLSRTAPSFISSPMNTGCEKEAASVTLLSRAFDPSIKSFVMVELCQIVTRDLENIKDLLKTQLNGFPGKSSLPLTLECVQGRYSLSAKTSVMLTRCPVIMNSKNKDSKIDSVHYRCFGKAVTKGC